MSPGQEPLDAAEAARHDRFGTLPERIAPEDMIQGKAATVYPAEDNYNPDDWLVRYCL
ncbi:MAG TPA: hypothetical protein VIS29_15015 [Streptomyces sp.]